MKLMRLWQYHVFGRIELISYLCQMCLKCLMCQNAKLGTDYESCCDYKDDRTMRIIMAWFLLKWLTYVEMRTFMFKYLIALIRKLR